MRRTFNCGVGMVVVVDGDDADEAIARLGDSNESAWKIGRVVAGSQEVQYV